MILVIPASNEGGWVGGERMTASMTHTQQLLGAYDMHEVKYESTKYAFTTMLCVFNGV